MKGPAGRSYTCAAAVLRLKAFSCSGDRVRRLALAAAYSAAVPAIAVSSLDPVNLPEACASSVPVYLHSSHWSIKFIEHADTTNTSMTARVRCLSHVGVLSNINNGHVMWGAD